MPERSIKPSSPETMSKVTGSGLARFDRAIKAVALWGGGVMLLGLIFLTVGDVVLRYCFNAPLFGARDIAKLMLLVIVAFSTAYSARTGGQVAIEVFSSFLGPRLLRVIDIAVRCVAAAMLAVLSWRLTISGLSAGRFGEASLSLKIPFAPFYFLFALGMLLYAAVLLVEITLLMRGGSIDPHADDKGDI
ncbi:MAG: TRAP transporter small permease subunit [Proteobacteria bacterium]|nr:TRAP transporter small permease subunit [Pseudomonadota bacterium]